MARITWKNVAAPNTGDVIRQQAIASRMINAGATGIGSTLQDLQTNSNRKLSAGAMQELGQIQDIGKFDELMKSGGLSQLGISADRASPELNKMLQGYRDTLEGKRESDQGFKEDVFQFGEDKYDASRERIMDGRAEDKRQRSEKQRLMNERATEAAREIAMDGTILDEAGIRAAVNARAGDDLEYRDALMQAALGRSEDVTRVNENVSLQPENQKRVQSFQDTQRGLRENLVLERTAGKNDADRMLFQTMAGISDGGFSNPLDAMLDRYLGTEPDGDGDDRKTYDETSASVTQTFNSLKEEFGDLPPELVAGALQHTVGGKKKWRFWQKSDELETKVADAREMLNKYREEGDINQMQVDRNAFEADLRSIDQQSQQLESTVTKLRTALSKPDPDPSTVMELRARLQELTKGEEATGTGNGGERDTESQAIMDESNDLIQRALDAAGGSTDPQSAPDQANMSPDQRAAQVYNNPFVEGVRGQMATAVDDTVNAASRFDRMLDLGAGKVFEGSMNMFGGMADDAAGIASLANENAGSSLYRMGDQIRNFSGNAGEVGLTGSAEGLAEEEAARQAETAATLREGFDATSARRQETESLAAATEGMSPEETAQFLQNRNSNEAATGTSTEPDPRVLEQASQDPVGTLETVLAESNISGSESQEVQEIIGYMQSGQFIRPQAKAQMQTRLKEIMGKAAANRGSGTNDMVSQLLSNPEKWLNF